MPNGTTLNTRAQSISEYVLLFTIVSIAILSMQIYMKRGIQAAVKVSADQLGEQAAIVRGNQYQVLSNSTSNTQSRGSTRVVTREGGAQTRAIDIRSESSSSSESSTQEMK